MPSLLGVRVDAVTYTEAMERCRSWLNHAGGTAADKPKLIFTPNPEILVKAADDPAFRAIVNQADLAIPDGTGLVWLARPRLPTRVTGCDLMIGLLQLVEQQGGVVGFVVRRDGLSSPEQLSIALKQRWPKLQHQIIYADENFSVAGRTSQLALICVALGCPAQEQWCVAQAKIVPSISRLFLTVGGGVDFLAGQAQRAPGFFRAIGLEWLWRLVLQPKRWRRILTATIVFPWYVLTRSK